MNPRELKLPERMFEFAVAVVDVTNALPRTTVGRNTGSQLFRAGTSGPANYEEACAAESRADFAHKLQIVLKELREAKFWLKLIYRMKLVSEDLILPALKESEELSNIIAKSVVTTKRNS